MEGGDDWRWIVAGTGRSVLYASSINHRNAFLVLSVGVEVKAEMVRAFVMLWCFTVSLCSSIITISFAIIIFAFPTNNAI